GAVVNSQSPNDIAEKAISLLQSPQVLSKAMHNARQAVLNKYNFESALAELEKFFFNHLK
ncbi:MAG: hypothetical protein IT254_00900, partial [Chitinophagaceae bacterium]|nr:hypothetical protein [Chitinophagaceae bacterium]